MKKKLPASTIGPRARGKAKAAADTARTVADSSPGTADIRSDGQRMLIGIAGSLSELARALGVGRSTVSDWRRGAKAPGDTARAKMRAVYGIPPAAWDRAVAAGAPAPVPAAEALRSTIIGGAALPSTLALVEEQLAILRGQQEGLTTQEAVRSADAIGRLLSRRAAMETATADLRGIILAHPDWIRFWTSLALKFEGRTDDLRDLVDEVSSWSMAR